MSPDAISPTASTSSRRASVSSRSYRQLARRLPNLWGLLYKHPLRSITRAQLADRLGKLEREHGSFAAVNARSILSALYNWAIKEGLTDVNPVTATRNIEVELTRDRVLSNDEPRRDLECSQ